jgi:hypothetical protein
MIIRTIAALALVALAVPAAAQDQTAQMLEAAKTMRAQAVQMKAMLPPDQIAALIKGAEEMEAQAKSGAFRGASGGAPAGSQDLAARLVAQHGRVDWLATKTVCVGFSWENHATFKMTTGDRLAERNRMCAEAYGHYARYFQAVRNGQGSAAAEPALADYDKAAKAAVAFYGEG